MSAPSPPSVPSVDSLYAILDHAAWRPALHAFARARGFDAILQLLESTRNFGTAPPGSAAQADLAVLLRPALKAANIDRRALTPCEAAIAKVRALRTAGSDISEVLGVLAEHCAALRRACERELVRDALPRWLASEQWRVLYFEARSGGGVASSAVATAARATQHARESTPLPLADARSPPPPAHTLSPLATTAAALSAPAAPPPSAAPAPSAAASSVIRVAMDTPSERTRSLVEILRAPAARTLLVDYCRSQHNDENAELLLAIWEFRAAQGARDAATVAGRLLDEYIAVRRAELP